MLSRRDLSLEGKDLLLVIAVNLEKRVKQIDVLVLRLGNYSTQGAIKVNHALIIVIYYTSG